MTQKKPKVLLIKTKWCGDDVINNTNKRISIYSGCKVKLSACNIAELRLIVETRSNHPELNPLRESDIF